MRSFRLNCGVYSELGRLIGVTGDPSGSRECCLGVDWGSLLSIMGGCRIIGAEPSSAISTCKCWHEELLILFSVQVGGVIVVFMMNIEGLGCRCRQCHPVSWLADQNDPPGVLVEHLVKDDEFLELIEEVVSHLWLSVI